MPRQCLDCPVSLEGYHPNRKYCDKCRERKYKELVERNKERWREYSRDWYKKSPGNMEKHRKSSRQTYANDPAKGREYSRQYRQEHPEKIKERNRQYRAINRERLNAERREKYQRKKESHE